MLAIAVSALAALQWQQVGNPIIGSGADDYFGYSTTLSNNGSILAIGNNAASDSRAKVYIQTTTSGSPTWDELSVGTIPTGSNNPGSVHFSTNAEFLAVGYPGSTGGQGKVFWYKHTPEGTNNYTRVSNSALGSAGDARGSAVVMFKDSSGTIGFLESAPYTDSASSGGPADIGDVYRTPLNTDATSIGVTVSIKTTDFTSNQNAFDYFGLTMDASDDGDTVVVCNNNGLIHFFLRGTNGQYSVIGFRIFDRLGLISVSMSSNGQRVAIGDWDSNSVQIRDYTFQWQTPVTIESPDFASAVNFGHSVSLSGDGTRLAVGDPGYYGERGRVYIFQEQSPGNWAQVGQVIEGESAGEQMGAHVTMSGDGTTVAVSAPDYSTDTDPDLGRVKIYKAVNSDDDDDEGLGTGAIVGIAVGATAGAAAIGAVAYYAIPSLFTGGKYKRVDQLFL